MLTQQKFGIILENKIVKIAVIKKMSTVKSVKVFPLNLYSYIKINLFQRVKYLLDHFHKVHPLSDLLQTPFSMSFWLKHIAFCFLC